NRLANFTCPEVMFKVDNLSVYERSVIGKNKDTVVLDCDVKCIKFKADDNWGSDLDCFDEVSVIGKLSINRWFNFRKRELIETPQIMIEEYAKSA
ncbi:hypothetical protein, partial [Mycobacterium tuberculosis]|uniref:hypothetical protein n=1 Tax=Mycobacterium tuberculosis TaxID=1773 RepID=UPI001BE1089C